ncbi:MAG: T9SS C-terminal target domain-containing protein [Bacteroidia bacterium]|nr:T9SS C-terminal target domain-containing protein [Bacteroidia bacterium]
MPYFCRYQYRMLRFLLLLLLVSGLAFNAQNAPRTWHDELGFNAVNTVCKSGNYIFAANYNGLIYFNQSDRIPKRLNRSNGLYETGIVLLRANPFNGKVLVVYDNAHIDVIDPDFEITPMPDLRLKTINGKKVIREITFYKQYAYLACGFGIVVIDTDKLEVNDTYFIGKRGADLDIIQVALNDTIMYAASTQGLLHCTYKIKYPGDYRNWNWDTVSVNSKQLSGIVNCNKTFFISYNLGDTSNQPSLYKRELSKWQPFPNIQAPYTHLILKLHAADSLLGIIDDYSIKAVHSKFGTTPIQINSFNGTATYYSIQDGIIIKDNTSNLCAWVADINVGIYSSLGNYPYYNQVPVKLSGMNGRTAGNIDIYKGKVRISPSYLSNAGVYNAIRRGISSKLDSIWVYTETRDVNAAALVDVCSVLTDRLDTSVFWVGTWFYGIQKYKNNTCIKYYNNANTPAMPQILPKEPRCTGLTMDGAGNLWFAHSDQKGFLSVIQRDGTFLNFEFDAARFTRKTLADKNGFIWALHERDGGLTVYNANGFNPPLKGINYHVLTKDIGNGNLESNAIYAIAEDLNGQIWIGTGAGIRVFYNPQNLFNSNSVIDAQPIKIVQDGNVEYLLGREAVTAICVDGANNKWVGTLSGGVYCFSPDGQTQLYHFTSENSALYSNTILDLNYDIQSGNLYVQSENGLQRYQSIYTIGQQQLNQLNVYPNPVKPGFLGTVMIRNLIDQAQVRITDENGFLVWESTSNGGQLEWGLLDYNSKPVAAGVYLIQVTDTYGTISAVEKILVLR